MKFKVGDIVVAKNSYGTYKKGKIERVCPQTQGYYVHFEDDTWRYCKEEYVRKVDPDFEINCHNCKHFEDHYKDCRSRGCIVFSTKGEYNKGWEPKDSKDIQVPHIEQISTDGLYISTGRGNGKTALLKKLEEVLNPVKPGVVDFKPTLTSDNEYLDFVRQINAINRNAIFGFGSGLTVNDPILQYIEADNKAMVELMADFNNKKENKNMKQQQKKRDRNIIKAKDGERRKIREIMFNGPATIIKWDPTWHQYANDIVGDKTVTVAKEPDKFDKTTGFLLAVLKEVLDNQSYGNVLEKIDEIKKFDELSKQTVEADLDNKNGIHCSIKDLEEQAEALEDIYLPGSVVRFKNGKKYYMIYCYRFDENLKEMVYILQPYKGNCFTDNNLEGIYKKNVPHSKLIRIRSK